MRPAKYVTTACLNCRRRKVKCDGTQPCTNCAASRLDCEFNPDGDLRRYSPKRIISSLEARVAQLEKTLLDNNIEPPPPLDSDFQRYRPAPRSQAASHNAVVDDGNAQPTARPIVGPAQVAIQSYPGDAPGCRPIVTEHVSMTPAAGSSALGETSWGGPPLIPAGGTGGSSQSRTPSLALPSSLDDPSHNPSCDPKEDDGSVTGKLATRMGSLKLAEDGQLHYYGSTSNLHLHRQDHVPFSHTTIRHVQREGIEVLSRLGLDRPVPPDLETHLARLYFTWEDPAIHCVDEQVFFEEKGRCMADQQATSPYYSETLNNAICSLGAFLSAAEDSSAGLLDPEFYAARAKALLDIEMDSPTVATVQALVILSGVEAALARDARGWLYSGMAVRLSADLGLDMALEEQARHGFLSLRDLRIRRTTYQGVFIHESLWASYVGRPGTLAATPPQFQESSPSEARWTPYRGRQPCESASADRDLEFPIELCTAANVALCEMMQRINTTLYHSRTGTGALPNDFLADTSRDLEHWCDTLQPSLRMDHDDPTTRCPPAVLQLHMQHQAVVIALLRPYLATTQARCLTAAYRICGILRRYKTQHSLKQVNMQVVPIILTAALVLVHDICVRIGSEATRQSHDEFQFCCRALGTIGQYYTHATRALETVILIKSEWQGMVAARRASHRSGGLKRPSGGISMPSDDRQHSPDASPPKKRNTHAGYARNGTLAQTARPLAIPAPFSSYYPVFEGIQVSWDGTPPTDASSLDMLQTVDYGDAGVEEFIASSWLHIDPSLGQDASIEMPEDARDEPEASIRS